ncbi:prolyl oligopeptidase [Lobosporangium transversale]|uniref:Prolyl endopeptidase-like n=1 Tax=Lobosporangium transversale TaxID=64571 RepID=A0A1Y2H096_9FUNG|nr:prolyl oligopeptidase [Lobosporangium transversale]ORZ27977.1 prolyl oligopeptidase [Lobosporangium transversale]|eukprot:XP_021885680.1 prolyl oligopeptidase [Lobosporangium transversale]
MPSNRRFRNKLPPLEEMDLFISQSANNLASLLPDMTENIRQLISRYPEVYLAVWERLRPILEEAETRDKLHGRNLELPSPPICAVKPEAYTNVHGEIIVDNYNWLKERDNPDVLKYIDEENQYAIAALSHTEPLQKLLYNEFVSRLDANKESARVVLPDRWSYYSKSQVGLEYRLHCRSILSPTLGYEEEQVYLDENEIAQSPEFKDSTYFRVGFLRHSPDCRILAYGVDSTGQEQFTTFFKDVETGELLNDRLTNIYENLEFSSCGRFVYYLTLVPETERAYRLYRHILGTSVNQDQLLYEEKDEMFCLTMTKSGDGKFIMINSAAQVTSETLFLHADATEDVRQLRVIMPRKEGITYSAESHSGKYFFVLTNENSKNNWLFRTPAPKCDSPAEMDLMSLRETVIPHRDFVLIEDFQVRRRHLVVFERSNCHQNVRVIELATPKGVDGCESRPEAPPCSIGLEPGPFDKYHYISFSEIVYSLLPESINEEVSNLSKMTLFDTNVLRFTYSSLVQPRQVIDYNMDTQESVMVHTEQIAGSPVYDPNRYEQLRLHSTGIDGTAVPMSIVFRRDLIDLGGKGWDANPCLLYTYGAYGSCTDPVFSTQRLSLLDRGFIYAIAHVRGGSDMGMGWYEEGKLAKKPNTFLDVISCAEYLIKEGYTSPEKLALYGRSAGGLMVGAVVNMRPDLFKTVLTEVPFVDALNTMLDSSIPWTAFEWEEWGNPEDPEIYRIMKHYCPYTNVHPQKYPNMLILGGMNDPRVAYFEPLKWAAKLRSCWPSKSTSLPARQLGEDGERAPGLDPEQSDDRMLLLRIGEVGHAGSSGQYSYLEDLAFEYAFLISTLQAPVFRIGKDDSNGADRRTRVMTPSAVRKKKGVITNELMVELENTHPNGTEVGIECDGRQPFLTMSGSHSRLASTATRDTGSGVGNGIDADGSALGGAASGGSNELYHRQPSLGLPLSLRTVPEPRREQQQPHRSLSSEPPQKNRSRFDELKTGEGSAVNQNRRRSTTLLEFSEKATKQNGKPGPASQGPRAQSRLAEWIANFF